MELKSFVNEGGTLLIDAAGGSTAFVQVMEMELTTIFGKEAVASLDKPLPPDDPIYKLAGMTIDNVRRLPRLLVRERLPESLKTPSLRAIDQRGANATVFSRRRPQRRAGRTAHRRHPRLRPGVGDGDRAECGRLGTWPLKRPRRREHYVGLGNAWV